MAGSESVRGSRWRDGLVWGLRIILAGLFVYAGAVKAIDPTGFMADIEGYRLLPHPVAWALAHYLPFLEVMAGVLLLIPRFARASAWVLSGLMLVFMIALLSAWIRGLDISCGCFGGKGAVDSYAWLLVRDLLILIGLGIILVGSDRNR